jgi:hypothetical protein
VLFPAKPSYKSIRPFLLQTAMPRRSRTLRIHGKLRHDHTFRRTSIGPKGFRFICLLLEGRRMPVNSRSYLSPTLVLLAFDYPEGKNDKDFLGFAIKREPGFDAAKFTYLPNRIGFDGPNKDGSSEGSDQWPIRSNTVTGRCEKIDFKICSDLDVKENALGCRIGDRWGVGKHLGSKIKSRKLQQINFFTSSSLPIAASSAVRPARSPRPSALEPGGQSVGRAGVPVRLRSPLCPVGARYPPPFSAR